jgi:hypothetical protein
VPPKRETARFLGAFWRPRHVDRCGVQPLCNDFSLGCTSGAGLTNPRPPGLVHAISPEAKRFYQRYGFVESPTIPHDLMFSLVDLDKILSGR